MAKTGGPGCGDGSIIFFRDPWRRITADLGILGDDRLVFGEIDPGRPAVSRRALGPLNVRVKLTQQLVCLGRGPAKPSPRESAGLWDVALTDELAQRHDIHP